MCLSIKVEKHMELCKARGTVILPLWKSSCFWTVFCGDGVHWNSFVIDWVFLPKFPGHFIRGKARKWFFGSRPLDFHRPRSPCAFFLLGANAILFHSIPAQLRKFFVLTLWVVGPYQAWSDLSHSIVCQYRVVTRGCVKNLFRIVWN